MFDWLFNIFSSKMTIRVTLNPADGADPAVTVESKDVDVTSHKVRWERDKTSPAFTFEDLDLVTVMFPDQRVTKLGQRLSCKNENADGEYKYTITVRVGENLYTTDTEGDGDGGKPVIRNKN